MGVWCVCTHVCMCCLGSFLKKWKKYGGYHKGKTNLKSTLSNIMDVCMCVCKCACVYVLLRFFSQETYSMAKSDGHCFKF